MAQGDAAGVVDAVAADPVVGVESFAWCCFGSGGVGGGGGGLMRQRAVILADLAASAVIEKQPERACECLEAALDQLGHYGYATAMDRVKTVRKSLGNDESLPAVRALDERLYDWSTTLNSLVS